MDSLQYHEILKEMKNKIWSAVEKDQPVPILPDAKNIFSGPASVYDVYYLLERAAYMVIWNAYDLNPPGKKVLLNLKGASPHYNVYDRGSCIVAAPKDLYSHERTPEDARITARAMGDEVFFKRPDWTLELGGFDKMVRIFWVHLQVLSKLHNKKVDILHYAAPPEDAIIYNKELEAATSGPTSSIKPEG